jgi:peptidoglycan hydrolase CwlO-like protein
MSNSRILNLNAIPAEPVNPEAPHPEDKVAQMGELIEQTRSDVRRMRNQLERQEDEHELHATKTKILSVILAFLIVGLAASFWFAYPSLRDQKKFALDMLGLQNNTGALGEHVQSLEAKFNKTAAELPSLSARMDQLGANMKTNLQSARTQAQAAATQAGQRIKAELNQSIQAIESRLAGLESNQKETSGHVNQLEEQIAGLKREIATMREQSSASAEKITAIQQEQQARGGDIARLDEKVGSHQTALDSISSRGERKRVEFQLSKRKAEQIAPGIFLAISHTDAGKQQVDGTLQFGDARALTIRSQEIQKPVSFYTTDETRPSELVFTEVTKNGVSGYLVMPGSETAQ